MEKHSVVTAELKSKSNPNQFRKNSNQISNNHDLLNFVKKNTKLMQLDKGKMNNPSAIQIIRNNSVFLNKDQQYKIEKLTTSLNSPYTYQKKQSTNEELINAKKIYEIIEKKNQEIQDSINKQRQSMSDIVYNYSKFRSMEQNYYKSQRNQKVKKKIDRKKVKEIDVVKFPLIPRSKQQVFTITYDEDGKRVVRINANFQPSPEKKKSQSLVGSHQQRISKAVVNHDQGKKDVNFFKRRKNQNVFGIQIKSINAKILENLDNSEPPLKLKKDFYEMTPTDFSRKSKLHQQIYSSNQLPLHQRQSVSLKKDEEIQENIEKSRQFGEYQSTEYDLNLPQGSSSFIMKNKPKFSLLSLDIDGRGPIIDEQIEQNYVGNENCDIIYFKEKQKIGEALVRKEKKSISMLNYSEKQLTVYDQKINSFRDFLFMMNLAHFKFDHLHFKDSNSLKNQDKYRFYIGKGNNSLLVQSIFKRRFWWIQEEDYKKSNMVWTQLKINLFYQLERKSDVDKSQSKLDSKVKVSPQKKKKLPKQMSQNNKNKLAYKPPLPSDKDKIFTLTDKYAYQQYEQNTTMSEIADKMNKFSNRLKYFEPNSLTSYREDRINEKMHNHLEFNHFIGNKKALFYNMKQFYQLRKKNPFEVIPLTFHIKEGVQDSEYAKFTKEFKKIQNEKYRKRKAEDQQVKKKLKNIWIVKPGQLSNRGNGIVVINEIYQLNNIFKKKQKHNDGNDKTYIVQKYIQSPLLYKGRKFDIRHYMLITRMHGLMRAYWYGEGYIRTSSYDFDLDDIGDEMIHLTNDAIQKNCTFYGKHQEGNKLSYAQFQRYLDQKYGEGKCSFSDHIYPKMKQIATDAVKSTYLQLDSNNLEHNFQIFGLDFMIDDNFKVWLIQVNTNPCLQISSKLLGRIIPNMLQHAFRLSIDVIYPPPCHYPNSQKYLAPDNPLSRLNYQLIFDQGRDGKQLIQLYRNAKKIDYGGEVIEDNEIYESEGKEIQLSPDLN